MERLTDSNAAGNFFYPKCFEKCDGFGVSSKCDNCEIATSICEKLGKYEDLEEQGRLVKLPCKVGDVVYVKMASYCKTHYVEAEVRDAEKMSDKHTNADMIRNMSDEELAEFLCKVKSDYQWMEHEFPSEEEHSEWEEWLQSEGE